MKKQYLKVLSILVSYLLIIHSDAWGQNLLPWKVSSPEEQQMSSKELINLLEFIDNKDFNIHSLFVIRNDKIVLDCYFYPFQKGYVHDLASVTKSITSLLIGIAIDKGFIADENQKVKSFFPEYMPTDKYFDELTIKDLLNMSSGLDCSWNDGEKELREMQNSPDWVEYMFKLPFSSKPGETCSYCSGNYYLLAEIIQRTTKMKCHEFARKYLFDLIEMNSNYWMENSKGVNHGWGDLMMSPYDLAKIGSLLLNDGKWNGKQIISKTWIDKIKPQLKINDSEDYGFGWWFERSVPDKFEGIGRGGQRLVIFKDEKIIIVMTGGGYDSGDIDDYVLASVKNYSPDKDQSSELKKMVKKVSLPVKSKKKDLIQDPPVDFLNKDYVFDENSLGINALYFSYNYTDKLYLLAILRADRTSEKHSFSIDKQHQISQGRVFGLPMSLQGFWDKNKLVIIYNELCRINLYQFTFTFYKGGLDFEFKDLTNYQNVILKGVEKNNGFY